MRLKRAMRQGVLTVPRALAVLSCALALLAAEPVVKGGEGAGMARGAVVVADGGSAGWVGAQETEGGRVRVRKETGRVWGSTGSRIHILATFEIFHRLLLAELHVPVAAERLLVPAMTLELVAAELVNPPLVLALRSQALDRQAYRTPPPERQYAILHCLLAPPIA